MLQSFQTMYRHSHYSVTPMSKYDFFSSLLFTVSGNTAQTPVGITTRLEQGGSLHFFIIYKILWNKQT